MDLKRKLLNDCKLYLVLDAEVNTEDQLYEIAEKAVQTDVGIIQLRDKKGTQKEFTGKALKIREIIAGRIPFIVNDRVDVAKACGADGIHLGQEDVPAVIARRILGPEAIIGISCQTMQHALGAVEDEADYIGFGSVFKTLTKPNRRPQDLSLLSEVVKEIQIPVFAIGGITSENISELHTCGIERVAVCRAISLADDVELAVGILKEQLSPSDDGKLMMEVGT